MTPLHSNLRTLHLVSLGCPKNLVDSEVMLAHFTKQKIQVTDNPQEADILLINTCGFIQSAVEEAIDEILHLAEFKKSGLKVYILPSSCL